MANNGSGLVKFKLKKDADVHFKLVQIQRCLFPRSFRYRVARTHFILGKITKSGVKFIHAAHSQTDHNFSIKPKEQLKSGEYCVYIQLDWNNEDISQFGFNLLSKQEIDYEVLYDEDNFKFLKECLKSYARNNVKKFRKPAKKGKGMEIKNELGLNTAGYGFYYYENNNKKGYILHEKLKFIKSEGIKFLYDQPLTDFYTIRVMPGGSEILLTKRISLNIKIKISHVTSSVEE